jgi:hypothetical protein
MQSKAKIVAFSVSAVLAAAIGTYLFTDGSDTSTPVQNAPAPAASAEPAGAISGPADAAGEAVVKDLAAAPVAASADKRETAPPAPAPAQPSGKLTAEQLTPPAPRTEEEKLQKAAEQEYNRF